MGKILVGDCIEVMRGMEENTVDAVICDPPYALGFMGKAWDRFPTDKGPKKPFANRSRESKLGGTPFQEWCQTWAVECLRVAKPGAYLLAFGGTRTFHRLACAIEDAGWVLKDTLMWCYGSGFPKSHDISKAIDRKAGGEREVVGENPNYRRAQADYHWAGGDTPTRQIISKEITAPATPEAKQWDGFGTALKPAWEPVILAQAPLEGTYAENVLKWGCGALNIDGCRIGASVETWPKSRSYAPGQIQPGGKGKTEATGPVPPGRWPANFLLSHTMFCEKVGMVKYKNPNYDGESLDSEYLEREDWHCVPDCPAAILDGQSGESESPASRPRSPDPPAQATWGLGRKGGTQVGHADQGGASRFFYCAKTSRSERNAGLEGRHDLFEKREGFEEKFSATMGDGIGKREHSPDEPNAWVKNAHPTVKPIALMRYLCRLVTPPGGCVLDPFAGSGSTGCAAVLEGFRFVGIEKEASYAEIARSRIEHWEGQRGRGPEQ